MQYPPGPPGYPPPGGYGPPPGPQGYAPPAPRRGTSGLVVALIAAGALAVLLVVVGAGLLLYSQTRRPTAADVCAQLVHSGLGRNCIETVPARSNARASARYDFDLTTVPGHKAMVLSFANRADYDATVEIFRNAAFITGPHRYGNERALIFVQANEGLALSEGRRLKAIVDGL